MKKNKFWVRLLTSILMIISLGLLVVTPVQLRVGNFHGLVKYVLEKQVKQQGSADLNDAWALVKQTGAEDQMLAGLPRHVHYEASYVSLYELSANKETNEKQVADEAVAPFKQEPVLAKLARRYVKKALHSDEVTQLNEYLDRYKNYFIAVVIVLAICVLLVLLGHSLGVWLGLVMAVGLYGLTAVITQQLAANLQSELYPGIEVTMGSNSTLAVLVMVVGVVVWQVGRHFAKRRGRQ
jgi:uncharacterized membrane protein YiaA